MKLDTPIIISFIFIFLSENYFGWGLFQDKLFIAFGVFLAFCYLFVTISKFNEQIKNSIKNLLLILFVAIAVFLATLQFSLLRHNTSVTGFINDSALQTEIAGKFLLLGKNPYSESFAHTDLAKWKYQDDALGKINPALYSNVITPFPIVLSAIGFRVFWKMFWWFDIRFLYLGFYLLLLFVGYLKFGNGEKLPSFLGLVAINPLFVNALSQGSNDVTVLSLILLAAFLLERKRILLAAVVIGISLAAKQSAWFAFPFFLFYLWIHQDKRSFYKVATIAAGIGLLFYLPFFFWNPNALISNLVFFVSGDAKTSYPINGYGFGGLVVKMGWVSSIYAYFPFWILQFGIGIPLLIWFLRIHKDCFTIQKLLIGYSFFLSAIWFFNRYLTITHLGFLAVLIASAFLWGENTEDKKAPSLLE